MLCVRANAFAGDGAVVVPAEDRHALREQVYIRHTFVNHQRCYLNKLDHNLRLEECVNAHLSPLDNVSGLLESLKCNLVPFGLM